MTDKPRATAAELFEQSWERNESIYRALAKIIPADLKEDESDEEPDELPDYHDEETNEMFRRAEARLAERLRVLDDDEAAGRRRLNEIESSL